MINKIRGVRLEKMKKIAEAGIDPYPAKTARSHKTNEAILNAEKLEKESAEIILAGRLMAIRGHGGSIFANIADDSGSFQIYFKKDDLIPSQWDLIGYFDVGDFIEATGKIFTTKKGEKTLLVSNCRILAKSLLPLPEKWHGLQDEEERLRKRYLDILFNPEIKEMIKKKSVFWNAVREFHLQRGFLEVETPVLENTTGGADANPFVTHHSAFDTDVYLRISAGELWQKRLMVAGFEKTFEIGRIFRNEGVSTEHLQDYTQCEAYWAYGNFEDMYKFLRDCYRFVAQKTFGTLGFKIRGFDVDLGADWPIIDYTETVKKETGIDIWQDNDKKIQEKLYELKIKSEANNRVRMVDALWKYCRKNIGGPAILINEPKFTSPLAKVLSSNPNITERFHFIIAGSEVGQGYSELNDPVDQRERFENQQKLRDAGDKEAQMADYDFVEALEYGMPPTCGHGFSERLFSFLMDKPIKECQIFPLMRPKEIKIKK
ncbi:MAG: lysine--tRNA ligase [bacterium]|nr:lysine--tRNA ligase [bacterium]